MSAQGVRIDRFCFVPGCKTGYSSDKKLSRLAGETYPSLFRAPNDPAVLKEWNKAIPRDDKIFGSNNVVCSLHFNEAEIMNFFETKMPDGSVNRIKRERPRLKEGSVPSKFPNLPFYLSNSRKRRKPPCERTESTEVKKKKGNHSKEPQSIDLIVERRTSDEVDLIVERETSDENENEAASVSSISLEKEKTPDLFQCLKHNLDKIQTPNGSWLGTLWPDRNEIIFAEWNKDYTTKKKIILHYDMSYKVLFGSAEVEIMGRDRIISNFTYLEEIIQIIHKMRVCEGIKTMSPDLCSGYLPIRKPGQKGALSKYCEHCKLKFCKDKKETVESFIAKRHQKLKGVVRCVTRKNLRLKQKITKLINEVEQCKKKCALFSSESLEQIISELPSSQQEAVRMCFAASKLINPKNQRYTLAWIYECLLIRIKGRATYEHLRKQKLLPLPCNVTLNKYIRRMNGCYGFQKSTFELLKKKSSCMKPEEKRGTLLIDEMKLNETLAFDSKTLKINGFTNLGEYTPLHQKNVKGDHALVMMFQPFRGSWVQSLACFLSKGCASSTVLHHLIIECIILLEKAGFSVDVVTTDGASWNRAMWKKFNISEENVSCEHVCEPSRQLWFSSDFPHLIKNFRNFVIQRSETWTPDGIVKIKHWDTVVELEQPNSFSLKICPKFSRDDVHPKHYQKMNVGRAYRFFSEKTAAAMDIYKKDNDNLKDCDPTTTLIRRISKLIEIMSSRTPQDKVFRRESEEEQFIKDFLTYISEWKKYANDNNIYFLSDNTYYGIIVTLKTTLDVMCYLCNNHDYEYLMTARLNQDSLERFFGMMRSACGSNDHPDSNLFAQMFRLMSTYSLVKPPKGSNVEGSEMIQTLLDVEEVVGSEEETVSLKNKLDTILEKSLSFPSSELTDDNVTDHPYHVMNTSPYILAYICGYIARKAKRFSNCQICLERVAGAPLENDADSNLLINILTKGSLKYPSKELERLIATLESAVLHILSTTAISQDTMANILNKLEDAPLPFIGCEEHKEEYTSAIVRFYLVSRMHFICKRKNIMDKDKKEKTRQLRKQSKL